MNVQHFLHVEYHFGGGRGRHTQNRYVREHGLQRAQEFIVGTKIVSPLRAAVHLVNGYHMQLLGQIAFLQCVHESLALRQALGRHVQQFKWN